MAIEAGRPSGYTSFVSKTGSAKRGDLIFKGVLLGFTLLVIILAGALLFVVVRGSREAIAQFGIIHFVTSTTWNAVTKHFGALPVIVGTLVSSLVAIILAVPVADSRATG